MIKLLETKLESYTFPAVSMSPTKFSDLSNHENLILRIEREF